MIRMTFFRIIIYIYQRRRGRFKWSYTSTKEEEGDSKVHIDLDLILQLPWSWLSCGIYIIVYLVLLQVVTVDLQIRVLQIVRTLGCAAATAWLFTMCPIHNTQQSYHRSHKLESQWHTHCSCTVLCTILRVKLFLVILRRRENIRTSS